MPPRLRALPIKRMRRPMFVGAKLADRAMAGGIERPETGDESHARIDLAQRQKPTESGIHAGDFYRSRTQYRPILLHLPRVSFGIVEFGMCQSVGPFDTMLGPMAPRFAWTAHTRQAIERDKSRDEFAADMFGLPTQRCSLALGRIRLRDRLLIAYIV